MSTINLANLPKPAVVEDIDFEATLAARKAALIALYPAAEQPAVAAALALESDPVAMLLQENVYLQIMLAARINRAAVAGMIAWAEDEDLDNLVADLNVKRLIIQPEDLTANPPVPEVAETDEALRERYLLAWDALSTAGPKGAYEYWARSADGRIIDAKAISPQPAEAVVSILSSEGTGAASSELIAAAMAACNDEDRRPVADRLTVKSAAVINYAVHAALTIGQTGAEAELILTAAKANLQSKLNPRKRIGVLIARSMIEAALHVEGVIKVELTGWTDIAPTDEQAAWCTGITVEQAP